MFACARSLCPGVVGACDQVMARRGARRTEAVAAAQARQGEEQAQAQLVATEAVASAERQKREVEVEQVAAERAQMLGAETKAAQQLDEAKRVAQQFQAQMVSVESSSDARNTEIATLRQALASDDHVQR